MVKKAVLSICEQSGSSYSQQAMYLTRHAPKNCCLFPALGVRSANIVSPWLHCVCVCFVFFPFFSMICSVNYLAHVYRCTNRTWLKKSPEWTSENMKKKKKINVCQRFFRVMGHCEVRLMSEWGGGKASDNSAIKQYKDVSHLTMLCFSMDSLAIRCLGLKKTPS